MKIKNNVALKRSRRNKKSLILILFAILIFMALSFLRINKISYGSDESYQDYIVQSGDRIWNIAERLSRLGEKDTRTYVAIIYKNNPNVQTIYPGMILKIPKID